VHTVRPPDLVTTAVAARSIGVSRRTLSRWVNSGLVKPTLTLPSGQHRWDLEELRRQLRALSDDGR
jgi:predicted site-specific integrase-resolvase